MKLRHPLLIVPVLLTLTGCGPTQVQRDIYQSKDECIADWGTNDLCQDVPTEQAQQNGSGHGGFVFIPGTRYFWGPSYYPGERAVDFNGKTYRPTSGARPFVNISSTSHAAMSSPGRAVSRGGFGGGGRSGMSFGG